MILVNKFAAGISARYHVNKYPTLKLFRNGELVKKEYRLGYFNVIVFISNHTFFCS